MQYKNKTGRYGWLGGGITVGVCIFLMILSGCIKSMNIPEQSEATAEAAVTEEAEQAAVTEKTEDESVKESAKKSTRESAGKPAKESVENPTINPIRESSQKEASAENPTKSLTKESSQKEESVRNSTKNPAKDSAEKEESAEPPAKNPAQNPAEKEESVENPAEKSTERYTEESTDAVRESAEQSGTASSEIPSEETEESTASPEEVYYSVTEDMIRTWFLEAFRRQRVQMGCPMVPEHAILQAQCQAHARWCAENRVQHSAGLSHFGRGYSFESISPIGTYMVSEPDGSANSNSVTYEGNARYFGGLGGVAHCAGLYTSDIALIGVGVARRPQSLDFIIVVQGVRTEDLFLLE